MVLPILRTFGTTYRILSIYIELIKKLSPTDIPIHHPSCELCPRLCVCYSRYILTRSAACPEGVSSDPRAELALREQGEPRINKDRKKNEKPSLRHAPQSFRHRRFTSLPTHDSSVLEEPHVEPTARLSNSRERAQVCLYHAIIAFREWMLAVGASLTYHQLGIAGRSLTRRVDEYATP